MLRPAHRRAHSHGPQPLPSCEKVSCNPSEFTSESQEAFFFKPQNRLFYFASFIDPGEKWGVVNHTDLSLAGQQEAEGCVVIQ